MRAGILLHIDSGHHLPGHPTCGRPHGHTYRIELTVEGPLVHGMVMDFSDVKKHLHAVIDPLDHITLNDVIPYPTCENICAHIAGELQRRLTLAFTLRVWEGDAKWVELDIPTRPA